MTTNPYTPAASTLYYGREHLMASLVHDEHAGQSVVLIGGRRCGKTRTLERVAGFLKSLATGVTPEIAWCEAVPDAHDIAAPTRDIPPHWPVIVNLQGRRFEGLSDLLTEIVDCIVADAPAHLTLPPLVTGTWALNTFDHWLQQVATALSKAEMSGSGIALLFDEVESILDKPWCHDFLAFLRRLVGIVSRTPI